MTRTPQLLIDGLRERIEGTFHELQNTGRHLGYSPDKTVLRGVHACDRQTHGSRLVMVDFAPEAGRTLFDLVRVEDELRVLFGREADLVTKRSIQISRNYLRRKAILGAAEVVYAT